jgi:putative YphP/YqiW family bacilliredoxin
MCGCAAGKARPGIALALQHPVKPDVVGTVFAGGDIEATERARQFFGAVPPSSPSIAIMRDGELLHFVHRHQIENQNADAIARNLTEAFDRLCGSTA